MAEVITFCTPFSSLAFHKGENSTRFSGLFFRKSRTDGSHAGRYPFGACILQFSSSRYDTTRGAKPRPEKRMVQARTARFSPAPSSFPGDLCSGREPEKTEKL